METREYHTDDITIIWEPSKCIHSAICFKGLPGVFNPRIKPWINTTGASTEAIVNQVKQCPSGAISYQKKNNPNDPKIEPVKDVSFIKVKVTPGGPLLIHGNFILEKDNESSTVKNQVTAFCRCGNSKNKPFCDGSHRNVEFDK
jgi:uncharacterized Fe-S cluster protein YjdI